MSERRNSLNKLHKEIAEQGVKSAAEGPADATIAAAMTQGAINGQGVIAVPEGKAPRDLSKALAMTQSTINNLGGPVYASMTDHKPVDAALVQAKVQMSISAQGEKSVNPDHTPADRALSEALTMKAINAGAKDALKKVEGAKDEGLSKEEIASLQAFAQAEKDQKAAARTFGGGDAKAGMAGILKDIEGQGGAIAVPVGKAPDGNVSLNHDKALMELAAGVKELKHAEGGDVVDKSLAQAKLLTGIAHKGESHADTSKVDGKERAINEALTMMAIATDKKADLKEAPKPKEGLTKEEIAALQEAAKQESA